MKKLFILLLFLAACKKQQYGESVKLPTQYTISATDTCYNYKTDTIYMWKNGVQIHPGSNLVVPGDTIRVYYNPGLDTCMQTDLNTMKVYLNGGKYMLKEYFCKCVSNDTFIIKLQP